VTDKVGVAITVVVAVIVVIVGVQIATLHSERLEGSDRQVHSPYEDYKWYELPGVQLLLIFLALVPVSVIVAHGLRWYAPDAGDPDG
jgi:H+/Cl- antiporter ClcA